MKSELTILGCRAGAPARNIAAPGYLLSHGNQQILIDCGPGVVMGLTADAGHDSLSAIIISHEHADHCLDLLALAYYRRFPVLLPPVPLYGPPSLKRALDLLDKAFDIPTLPTLSRPLAAAFPFTPVVPGQGFTIGELRVDTLASQHPVETLCLRFPDLGVVYTADGALSDALVGFASGARLLLSEATYPTPDGHNLLEHGHMTAFQAGTLAREAQAETLILTHLSDYSQAALSCQEARRAFGGHTVLASPGLHLSW